MKPSHRIRKATVELALAADLLLHIVAVPIDEFRFRKNISLVSMFCIDLICAVVAMSSCNYLLGGNLLCLVSPGSCCCATSNRLTSAWRLLLKHAAEAFRRIHMLTNPSRKARESGQQKPVFEEPRKRVTQNENHADLGIRHYDQMH